MEQKSNVKSRVIKTELINWRELQFIQDETFKELPADAKHRLHTAILCLGR